MKKLLFIIFILFVESVYSQTSIQKYYAYVNKAELLICDQKYVEAIAFYDSARLNMLPWNVDLLNAIQCAIDANNKGKVLEYSQILLSKRFNLYNPKSSIYKSLVIYDAEIANNIAKYSGPYLCNSFDSLFVKELKVRLVEDQRVDRLRAKIFSKAAVDSLAQSYIDTFSLVLLNNGLWLKGWIKNNGYPREECYYNPNFRDNPFAHISTLLIHYFSEHYSLFYQLKESVNRGDMHPIDLASRIQRTTPIKRERFKEYGITTHYFVNDSLSEQTYNIEEINRNRAELMLEPYEDYLQKVNYFLKNGDEKYYFRYGSAIVVLGDWNSYMNYLNKRFRNGSHN